MVGRPASRNCRSLSKDGRRHRRFGRPNRSGGVRRHGLGRPLEQAHVFCRLQFLLGRGGRLPRGARRRCARITIGVQGACGFRHRTGDNGAALRPSGEPGGQCAGGRPEARSGDCGGRSVAEALRRDSRGEGRRCAVCSALRESASRSRRQYGRLPWGSSGRHAGQRNGTSGHHGALPDILADGRPIAIDIVGRGLHADAEILAYAYDFEQETRLRQPPPEL